MSAGDLYSLLGVSPSATAAEVKAAYQAAARRFHPDANPNPGAAEEFKRIADAYAILSDTAQRESYDAALDSGSQPLLTVHHVFSRSPLPALAEPQVKSAVIQVIDNLRENDTFSVVSFSDRAEVVVPAQRGLAEKTLAKARVSTISASGGTEILQGILCGLTELHRHLSPAAVNHLLLLTDGRTYGDEEDCLMLAGLAATDGIVVSGLGIGEEWNDRFVDELAGRTGGSVTYLRSPQGVAAFINERVRGLGSSYAERLSVQVTLDAGIHLQTVFKVLPEAGPVPVEQPLRLGGLLKRQTVSVLFKFRLPPLSPGDYAVARLIILADVVSLGRRTERVTLDLALPAVMNTPPAAPPGVLVDALGKLSQYQMQERAWQQAAAGDLAGAVERLKALGTRLLASGQAELARVALNEAARLERTNLLSDDAKKQLKYGTRALISSASPTRHAA